MTTYSHRCAKCGEMDLERPMSAPAPIKCPRCGLSGLERIYNAHLRGAVDAAQELQNDGLGMFYPQLGKQFLDPHTKTRRNPDSHARSRAEAIEKAKRQGYQEINKC